MQDETFGELLIAPVLFPFELGNLCWKKLRRFPAEAEALRRNWTNWNISPPVSLTDVELGGTMQLARVHNLTFYDASYLWLAQDRGADLVSLDAPLVRAARSLGLHAPTPDDTGHVTPSSRN